MCIAFLTYKPGEIKLAANREENTRRPMTEPVHYHNGLVHAVIAGEDRGMDGKMPTVGTWNGVNTRGLVVAVLNRDDGELHGEAITKSRGLLCAELLGCLDAYDAAGFACREVMRGGYGGLNLVVADRKEAYIIHAPGRYRLSVEQLQEGLFIICNMNLNDPTDERIKFIRENYYPHDFVAWAKKMCCHEKIVTPDEHHGTLCSTIITVDESIHFLHAIGHTGEFKDYTHLLDAQDVPNS